MSIELPSFEEAVYLFEQWGFCVEPGPRPDEVTLILEGGDFRTYVVYEVPLLPQIANLILRTRLFCRRACKLLSGDWIEWRRSSN